MQPVFVLESRTRALQRLPQPFPRVFVHSYLFCLGGTLNGLEEEDFPRPECSTRCPTTAGQSFRGRLCETSFEKRKQNEPG